MRPPFLFGAARMGYTLVSKIQIGIPLIDAT